MAIISFSLQSGAHALTSQKIQEIPLQKLVYVDQREYAVVSPHDGESSNFFFPLH